MKINVMFSFRKILRQNMLKKNYFFIFDFTIENIKENELK